MLIELEVTDRTAEMLDSLTKRLNLSSQAETVNHALSLLDWAAEEAGGGRTIGSHDTVAKDFREIVLLPLRGHIVARDEQSGTEHQKETFVPTRQTTYSSTGRSTAAIIEHDREQFSGEDATWSVTAWLPAGLYLAVLDEANAESAAPMQCSSSS